MEPIALTGVSLDRATDGQRTDPEWVEAQRRSATARALVTGDAGVAVSDGRLSMVALERTRPPAGTDPLLLGLDELGPIWAIDETEPRTAERMAMVGSGGRRGEPTVVAPDRIAMREAFGLLDDEQAALASYAAAIVNWHRGHRWCGACGGATIAAEAGMARSCESCRTQHHPRVDPVVIMLVADSERLLLGRQASWPEGRYSALAGFVSPGESLEEAVGREVAEEAGVSVGVPRYVASQPWPFPGSVMIGFIARWTSGEPGGADPELEDVRWFDRAEVARACERDDAWVDGTGDGLLLPPRTAIARRLVERWLSSP